MLKFHCKLINGHDWLGGAHFARESWQEGIAELKRLYASHVSTDGSRIELELSEDVHDETTRMITATHRFGTITFSALVELDRALELSSHEEFIALNPFSFSPPTTDAVDSVTRTLSSHQAGGSLTSSPASRARRRLSLGGWAQARAEEEAADDTEEALAAEGGADAARAVSEALVTAAAGAEAAASAGGVASAAAEHAPHSKEAAVIVRRIFPRGACASRVRAAGGGDVITCSGSLKVEVLPAPLQSNRAVKPESVDVGISWVSGPVEPTIGARADTTGMSAAEALAEAFKDISPRRDRP